MHTVVRIYGQFLVIYRTTLPFPFNSPSLRLTPLFSAHCLPSFPSYCLSHRLSHFLPHRPSDFPSRRLSYFPSYCSPCPLLTATSVSTFTSRVHFQISLSTSISHFPRPFPIFTSISRLLAPSSKVSVSNNKKTHNFRGNSSGLLSWQAQKSANS
jgi:hypothetical protein